MTRQTRTLDAEFRPAAERRVHLVAADDMAIIKLGLSTATSALNWNRPMTADERARISAAYQALASCLIELPCTLEDHVRRSKGRIG